MSPASQGNLEIERYIGSCLISSSLRVNNISGKNNTGHHNSYKGKKVADGGGSPRIGKLQNHCATGGSKNNGGGSCQDHQFGHIATGGYSSPSSLLPLCECGGLKFGGGRYGSPGPNTGVGGSWAGLPLISMAPSNSRRNRKPSTSPNTSANNGTRLSKISSSGTHPATVVTNTGKNGVADVESGSQQSRTPLSRLAIHTQGAPLILAGRYAFNGRKNNVCHSRGPPSRQFRGSDLSVRRSNSVRDTRDTGTSNSSVSGSSSNTPNSDCLSVASDESSGHSENSLPRIIKPRKRRKKDRKPPPTTNTPPSDTSSSSPPSELKISTVESPGIVTLKPYVPLCYALYDNARWNRRILPKDGQVWEGDKQQALTSANEPNVEVDDEQISQTSEEDNQEPKLHHNFDDVEENDEGLHVDTSALFPYPCPPTLCQCRYCDPAGLIWDVDQHCYSPFLTPPSLTAENKNKTFTKSPLSNIPLFLTPPPTEVRSFDFFNKELRSSPSVFLPENDHSSVLLRRSWSEPLPSSFSSGNSIESRGIFGVIGRGRVCDDENTTDSHQVPRCELQTSTCDVSSSNVSITASQSLEVSTEIVTSPNGHRDIEIKFYSSSPPVGATVVPAGSSDTRSTINSLSSEDEIDHQSTLDIGELIQNENSERNACVAGNSQEQVSDECTQDVTQCVKEKNVRGGKACDDKGCNISDHGFCEQRAKALEKEVDQLRLHAEE